MTHQLTNGYTMKDYQSRMERGRNQKSFKVQLLKKSTENLMEENLSEAVSAGLQIARIVDAVGQGTDVSRHASVWASVPVHLMTNRDSWNR
jgi:hypothetical protein